MVGTEVVDKDKLLDVPATVGAVNCEWLWLGRAWVKKSDCTNLQQAFDYFDNEVRAKPTSKRFISKWGFVVAGVLFLLAAVLPVADGATVQPIFLVLSLMFLVIGAGIAKLRKQSARYEKA